MQYSGLDCGSLQERSVVYMDNITARLELQTEQGCITFTARLLLQPVYLHLLQPMFEGELR